MGEIRDEMLSKAKRKLAAGGLSTADREYFEHVIADFTERDEPATAAASGRVQEAAKPAASSAPAAQPGYATFFGGARHIQEQRATFFGKPATPAASRLQESERRTFFGK